MKTAKRIHAIIILAVCLCLIFTGCDNESENAANSDKVKDLINMPAAETIRIMLPNDAGSVPKDVIDEINARTRKTLNLTVEFEKAYEAFRGKDTAEVMKRKEFDAIVLWYNFSELAYQDVLMDLNELLPQYAPNIYASLSEADKKFASYNGKMLAVPSHGDKVSGYYFVVRSDIAQRCGITQISTIEDVEYALQTIRAKESITPIYKDSIDPLILMRGKNFISLTGYYLYKKDDSAMKISPIEQFDEYSRASELFIN